MKIKGQLCISRPTSNSGEEWINIEFTDVDASIRFACFKVDLAGFTKALTGLGYVPGEIELRGLERVGTKAENKVEFIKCNPYEDKSMLPLLVRKLEVDGWAARAGDWENSHNFTKNGVRVVFFRNVPKEQP